MAISDSWQVPAASPRGSEMPGQSQRRSTLLRLAMMTAIAVGGAGAWHFCRSTPDGHLRLVRMLELINVIVEAAATQVVRLLMEFRLDLASF